MPTIYAVESALTSGGGLLRSLMNVGASCPQSLGSCLQQDEFQLGNLVASDLVKVMPYISTTRGA